MDMLSILRDPMLITKGIASQRSYVGNDIIISEGMEDRRLYLIEEGGARVSGRVELASGRFIQPGLCDLGSGDVFGELSLLNAGPRSASVTALGSTRVLELDAVAFRSYLDSHPQSGYVVVSTLLNILASRLRRTDRRWQRLFAWGLNAHGIDQHM